MPLSPAKLTLLAAGATAGAWGADAAAQDAPQSVSQSAPPPAPSFAFGAGAASDYVFRGISRTDGHAQVFASLDAGLADAYAGIWASNVSLRRFGRAGSGAEIDAYGGWRPELFGYSLDLGAQYDAFTDQPDGAGLDYAELYAKASRAIGPVTGRLSVHYSPAFTAHAGQAWYAEAGGDYALARDWSLSAAAGYQTQARPPLTTPPAGDYATWNAGITHTLGDHLAFDLRYFDTDHHGYGQAYGSRLVGQIRASF